MERIKLYADSFRNEENHVFQLEYFLLIRSAEQGENLRRRDCYDRSGRHS